MFWIGYSNACEHFLVEKQLPRGDVEHFAHSVDRKSQGREFRVDARGMERRKTAKGQARARLRFRLAVLEEENGAVALEDSDLVSVYVRGPAIRDGNSLCGIQITKLDCGIRFLTEECEARIRAELRGVNRTGKSSDRLSGGKRNNGWWLGPGAV